MGADPFPDKLIADKPTDGTVMVPIRTDQLGWPMDLKCSEE